MQDSHPAQAATIHTELVPIDQIIIRDRHRRDMGDIAGLAASIADIGLMHFIVLTRTPDGWRLVAGERRTLAFRHLGRDTIPARILDIDEIIVAERAENEDRKNFTVSESVDIGRAVEARIGNRRGQRTDRLSQQIGEVTKGRKTDAIAAEKAGFGNAETYRLAKIVTAKGVPELIEAVDAEDISIAAAADIASAPLERQREIKSIVLRGADGKPTPEARKFIQEVRAEGVAQKKARRVEREAELGAKQKALPDERYGVVLADPEWPFETYHPDTGADRSASNHYPTSPLEVIKARNVLGIAAPDCVLFLWATVPILPQALEVMQAWGFAYKSSFVWVKPKAGTGHWNRNRHELLLVGTRGNIPAPAQGTQWQSVIEAPTGRHSEKPEAFYELIESYFPNLPKIELNARTARPGWDRWGNEAPTDDDAASESTTTN